MHHRENNIKTALPAFAPRAVPALICCVLAIVLFMPGACGVNDEAAGSGEDADFVYVEPSLITPRAAKQMMDEEKGYVLLDVRSIDEYREKHIEGAVLLPDHEINAKAGEEIPDKGSLIFVYCGSGARSARAAQALAWLGYTRVYDIGSIKSWPYDTVSLSPETPED